MFNLDLARLFQWCHFPVTKLLSYQRTRLTSSPVQNSRTVRITCWIQFPEFQIPRLRVGMQFKDIFWMACDSTESLRAEYGPFHTREEAEAEARKLGFKYLLRYEHVLNSNEEIEEVRCVFIELQNLASAPKPGVTFHTRCASCGLAATHEHPWQAEVWADIHEFEHSRHKVRLFEHSRGEGLRETGGSRGNAA